MTRFETDLTNARLQCNRDASGPIVVFPIDCCNRGVFLWFVPIKSYDVYRMRARILPSEKKVLLQDERETYLKSWTRLRHEFFKGVYELACEKDKLWSGVVEKTARSASSTATRSTRKS